MKIILTHAESEEYFYSALCNGLNYISVFGVCKDSTFEAVYQKAREALDDGEKTICYEDVLMKILKDGNTFYFYDSEEDEKMPVTLKNVHERVQLTPFNHLKDIIDETDDAITADAILQTVIFKEVIYG